MFTLRSVGVSAGTTYCTTVLPKNISFHVSFKLQINVYYFQVLSKSAQGYLARKIFKYL